MLPVGGCSALRPCGGPGTCVECSHETGTAYPLTRARSCSRTFPIQGGLRIPWWAAQRAYEVYARRYGRSQSLERMAERGGFGLSEWAGLFLDKSPRLLSRSNLDALDRMTSEALGAVFKEAP